MTYIETTLGVAWSANSGNIPDATIRTRWQDFDTLLQSLGLIEVTTETGRISSFATINLNVATETFYGFKLYQLTDARQASRPILIKVEFGVTRAGTAVDLNFGPSFRITLLSGTDGAGNVGAGQSSSGAFLIGVGNSSNYLAAQFRAVYSAVFGCLYIGLIASTSADFISLERLRDPSGVPTNEGFEVRCGSQRAGSFQFNRVVKTNSASSWLHTRNINSSTSNAAGGNVLAGPGMISGESMSYDGATGMFLHHPLTFKPYPPNMAILGVMAVDFGAETVVTVSRYGTPQTYKCIPPQSSGGQAAVSSSQARTAICTSI